MKQRNLLKTVPLIKYKYSVNNSIFLIIINVQE